MSHTSASRRFRGIRGGKGKARFVRGAFQIRRWGYKFANEYVVEEFTGGGGYASASVAVAGIQCGVGELRDSKRYVLSVCCVMPATTALYGNSVYPHTSSIPSIGNQRSLNIQWNLSLLTELKW